MLKQIQNFLFEKTNKERIPVNKREQKELLIHVLKHAQSMIKHYSIEDPTNRYIDLMLAPGMIGEAIEMLEGKGIRTRGLLIDYPIVEHKLKKLRKGRH